MKEGIFSERRSRGNAKKTGMSPSIKLLPPPD